MSGIHQQFGSAPFDAAAARYDEIFTSSKIGQAQRAAVSVDLAKTFRSGDRVLEIGCGTGEDACFLAERGVRVVASDSSSEMIAVAAHKVQEKRLQELVRPIQLQAEDIGTLLAGERFDGAFSNFGAVNCIRDVKQLAANLHQLLNPGAKVLLCCLGPLCLWEIVWHLTHGQPRKAFRRLRSDNIARISNGSPLRVNYPSVRSLASAFAPQFVLRSVKGVGVLVPPSYVESWANRSPGLLRIAIASDSWLECCPGIRGLADHILLTFERRNA